MDLFSKSKMPEQKMPAMPKVDDDTLTNAANAERLRRIRGLGKQQSIFAGNMSTSPQLINSKLGGGV